MLTEQQRLQTFESFRSSQRAATARWQPASAARQARTRNLNQREIQAKNFLMTVYSVITTSSLR